ncbi:heme exporter protein CcmD [Brevundimonas sp. LM2]|uniref:heme exporter protein CcmD n=1 Tax=Brevundimonas sp. LM2 TaxID=1938605 RepID=UPI000983B50B|nr:heme exporter protein CcmD [Brevundimonas sp. LM2]AQR60333.1 heme exporter protein CcmD [Brevundimonas sp. LM2]
MPDFDMSPYAAFVWPAWGISAVVLGAVVVRALAASRRWKAALQSLEDTPADRPQAAQGAVGPQE